MRAGVLRLGTEVGFLAVGIGLWAAAAVGAVPGSLVFPAVIVGLVSLLLGAIAVVFEFGFWLAGTPSSVVVVTGAGLDWLSFKRAPTLARGTQGFYVTDKKTPATYLGGQRDPARRGTTFHQLLVHTPDLGDRLDRVEWIGSVPVGTAAFEPSQPPPGFHMVTAVNGVTITCLCGWQCPSPEYERHRRTARPHRSIST